MSLKGEESEGIFVKNECFFWLKKDEGLDLQIRDNFTPFNQIAHYVIHNCHKKKSTNKSYHGMETSPMH